MDVLAIWPGNGSVWLLDAYYQADERYGEIVRGDVYEEISGWNIPEGGPYHERIPMWFPRSCVLKEKE